MDFPSEVPPCMTWLKRGRDEMKHNHHRAEVLGRLDLGKKSTKKQCKDLRIPASNFQVSLQCHVQARVMRDAMRMQETWHDCDDGDAQGWGWRKWEEAM